MGQDQMKLIFTALPRTLISKIGLKKKKKNKKQKKTLQVCISEEFNK